MDTLCATEFWARDTKVNSIEDGTDEQVEFTGDQKGHQTVEASQKGWTLLEMGGRGGGKGIPGSGKGIR